ncbi:hypothetical protein HPB47_017839, partial [Ixodes persulcatus]
PEEILNTPTGQSLHSEDYGGVSTIPPHLEDVDKTCPVKEEPEEFAATLGMEETVDVAEESSDCGGSRSLSSSRGRLVKECLDEQPPPSLPVTAAAKETGMNSEPARPDHRCLSNLSRKAIVAVVFPLPFFYPPPLFALPNTRFFLFLSSILLLVFVMKNVEAAGFRILRLVTYNHVVNVSAVKILSGGFLTYRIEHPCNSERLLFLSFD